MLPLAMDEPTLEIWYFLLETLSSFMYYMLITFNKYIQSGIEIKCSWMLHVYQNLINTVHYSSSKVHLTFQQGPEKNHQRWFKLIKAASDSTWQAPLILTRPVITIKSLPISCFGNILTVLSFIFDSACMIRSYTEF